MGIFTKEEIKMPVYYNHNEEGTASSIQVEPFLPIHDLDLTKFKEHIEYC